MATTNEELKATLGEMQKNQGEMLTAIAVMQADVHRWANAAEENRRALRGVNGAVGLVARVENLERMERECEIGRVVKALDGDEKDPGLNERIRHLEEMKRDIRYWTYLMLGAVALGVINATLNAIPKLIALLGN